MVHFPRTISLQAFKLSAIAFLIDFPFPIFVSPLQNSISTHSLTSFHNLPNHCWQFRQKNGKSASEKPLQNTEVCQKKQGLIHLKFNLASECLHQAFLSVNNSNFQIGKSEAISFSTLRGRESEQLVQCRFPSAEVLERPIHQILAKYKIFLKTGTNEKVIGKRARPQFTIRDSLLEMKSFFSAYVNF